MSPSGRIGVRCIASRFRRALFADYQRSRGRLYEFMPAPVSSAGRRLGVSADERKKHRAGRGQRGDDVRTRQVWFAAPFGVGPWCLLIAERRRKRFATWLPTARSPDPQSKRQTSWKLASRCRPSRRLSVGHATWVAQAASRGRDAATGGSSGSCPSTRSRRNMTEKRTSPVRTTHRTTSSAASTMPLDGWTVSGARPPGAQQDQSPLRAIAEKTSDKGIIFAPRLAETCGEAAMYSAHANSPPAIGVPAQQQRE